jgi:1-acyl-sn-glycerol-3-phosphate acyltransferase
MTRRLRQFLRTCRGAFGFALFGALALGLTCVVLPIDRWLRPPGAELRAQRALHRTARFFLRIVERLAILRIDVYGAERLRAGIPRVVVANHPTLFDVILLCSILPQMDCVVNPSWARNFFLRGLVASAGYVRSDAARAVVRECVWRLAEGRSLLVFPEGTRSPRGGLGDFHRGAAHIALVGEASLVPVLIQCDPPIQSKGQKWYDLAARPVRVTIRVRDEIPSRPLVESGMGPARASRELTRELRESFAKGLELVDVGT